MRFYPRLTIAEIDLSAFRHNLAQIRSLIGKRTKLMPVIKANAYGHGLERIAQECQKAGADFLAVACLGEVIRIRKAGVALPIVNLGAMLSSEAEVVGKYDFTPTVFSWQLAKRLSQLGKKAKKGKKVTVHLKVDTGMSRIGLQPDQVLPFVRKVRQLSGIEIEGIFTHFACADEPKHKATKLQITRFEKVLGQSRKAGIKIPLVHAANSAATLWFPKAYYDLVRPGLIIYGVSPNPKIKLPLKFKPVMKLKTFIVHLKKVPGGTPISYGWTYWTKGETLIATLPVGYADGLRRGPKNQGQVLVRGKRVPIIGRVCMDQIMIDVTGVPGVGVGDEVVLLGRQGKEEMTAWEVAERIGTIPYEVLTSVGERVTRRYKR